MVDYSRFDHIDVNDDDDDEINAREVTEKAPTMSSPVVDSMKSVRMTSKTADGRLKFEYEGRTIYEWEQSLDECNIYIKHPEGVPKALLDIVIGYNHLKVGLKGAPPFLDEDIFSTVITEVL